MKLITGIYTLLALITISNASEWQVLTNDYNYKGNNFSCMVKPSGVIHDLTVKDITIFERIYLFARPIVTGSKDDPRVFQNYKDKCDSIKYLQKNDGTVVVKAFGKFGNQPLGDIATFNEVITFSNDEIIFDYKVETTKDLLIRNNMIFFLIQRTPVNLFTARKTTYDTANDKNISFEIPAVYNKEKPIPRGIKTRLQIDLDEGSIVIQSENGSGMDVMDTRSYKGGDIRVDHKPIASWRPKGQQELPAGTKIKINFKIKLTK